MAAIVCNGLTKKFGKTTALHQVDLKLEPGRIVGLAGPNGSGKTTLIKLAQHMLVPTDGEIMVNDRTPGPETKAHVAYLPDRDFLPDWMKVDALIRLYEKFYEDFNRETAEIMLRNLDISPSICSMSRSPALIRQRATISSARSFPIIIRRDLC